MPRVNPERARRRPARLLDADVEAKTVHWYAGFLRLFEVSLCKDGFSGIGGLVAASPPQLLPRAAHLLQQADLQQWLSRTEAGGLISSLRRCLLHFVATSLIWEMPTAGVYVLGRMYRSWRVQKPKELCTPIPVEFCHAMAKAFCLKRDFLAAFGILLMLHGLLRWQEALALTWHEVLVLDRRRQEANGRPSGLFRVGLARMRSRGLGRQKFASCAAPGCVEPLS